MRPFLDWISNNVKTTEKTWFSTVSSKDHQFCLLWHFEHCHLEEIFASVTAKSVSHILLVAMKDKHIHIQNEDWKKSKDWLTKCFVALQIKIVVGKTPSFWRIKVIVQNCCSMAEEIRQVYRVTDTRVSQAVNSNVQNILKTWHLWPSKKICKTTIRKWIIQPLSHSIWKSQSKQASFKILRFSKLFLHMKNLFRTLKLFL